MIKKIINITLITGALLFAQNALAFDGNIAIVNTTEIIKSSKAFKGVQAEIEKKAKFFQAKARKKEESLNKKIQRT